MVKRFPIFEVSEEQHVRTGRNFALTTRFAFTDEAFTSWRWYPNACWTPVVGNVRDKPIGYLVAGYLGARQL